MARAPHTEIKVGLIVLLSLVLLVTLTLAAGNFGDLFADKIRVEIAIPSVVGLEVYAPVTYSGVRIGRVMDIRYDGEANMAVIEAEIERDSPVALDSECRFTSAGLLSSLFIEISGGSPEKRLARLLRIGEIEEGNITLEAAPYLSVGELFALAGDVKTTLGKVEEVLDNLNGPIRSAGDLIQDVSGEIKTLLAGVRGLVDRGGGKIELALDNANGFVAAASAEAIPALANVRRTAERLPGAIGRAEEKIGRLLEDADGMIAAASPEIILLAATLRETAEDFRGQAARLEEKLSAALDGAGGLIEENRQDIRVMAGHLARTSRRLDDLMDQLARHPWRALWKTEESRRPPRVSPEWKPDLNR